MQAHRHRHRHSGISRIEQCCSPPAIIDVMSTNRSRVTPRPEAGFVSLAGGPRRSVRSENYRIEITVSCHHLRMPRVAAVGGSTSQLKSRREEKHKKS